MNLIATTVIRHSIIGEQASGHILEIDWERKRIIRSMPVPDPKFPSSNTNPRGGLRGGRGVKAWQGRYYVANYDTVYVYDADWHIQDEISHPLATDIHEIDLDESGIWLSCSRYDLALKLGYDGRLLDHWHISDCTTLMRDLRIRCSPIDLAHDYRRHLPTGLDFTHLNCVQFGPGNSVVVNLGQIQPQTLSHRAGRWLFPSKGYSAHSLTPAKRRLYQRLHGSYSCIVSLDRANPDSAKVLSQYPALRPNHNGQLLDDNTTVLASEDGGVVISQIDTKDSQHIQVPGTWVRGIAKLGGDRLLVGIQPCAIIEVDRSTSSVCGHLKLSDDPNASIHGLTVVP